MNKGICVYCSSSYSVNEVYFQQAKILGEKIAQRKDFLVYGGSSVGLMGEVASAVHENSGLVKGVFPRTLLQREEIIRENCDELIMVDDMRERKANMEEMADAFITLPGGYGTLEELLEIITAKTLNLHNKPIVILNTNNFYDGLLKQFELVFSEKFASYDCKNGYFITEHIDKAFDYIDNCKRDIRIQKWC